MTSGIASSLPGLIERTQIKLKVRPDLRGVLREEVEQWVTEAEGLLAIIDPEFEHLSDVYDLAREVKETKEWLGSMDFVVNPEFLDVEMSAVSGPTALRGPSKEPEMVGLVVRESEEGKDSVREPETSLIRSSVEDSAPVVEPIAVPPESLQPSAIVQPVGTKRRPMFLLSGDEGEDAPTPKKPHKERARSPTPEIVAVEPTPAHRRKGQANAQVTESDKIPQSVAKHGYPEHADLLGWLIYNGAGDAFAMVIPAVVRRERCVGGAFTIASAVLQQRSTWRRTRRMVESQRRRSEGRRGVLDTPEGTRMSTLAGEERMEELVERSEDLMRNVLVKLNELSVKLSALNGAVLEPEGVQATIRKLMK
ncbi:hypothetical protein JB92DRAFT_3217175 [Gautieria morchelliformis]|nr:hypothetical protein JB92DRAFT_3217175 [Gautieria morchelliformis]